MQDVALSSSSSLAVADALSEGKRLIKRQAIPMGEVSVVAGHDSLWFEVLIEGRGGFALRSGGFSGQRLLSVRANGDGYVLQFVGIEARVEPIFEDRLVRVRTWITPDRDMVLPFVPRDFYPLDRESDPKGTNGEVHCRQSMLGAPIVYLSLSEPEVGSFLYFQNFTELNPYFVSTKTKPYEAVGGRWPELGYLPPTSPENKLKGGKEILLSDAMVVHDALIPKDSAGRGRQLVEMLAEIYPRLAKPGTATHDWLGMIDKTVDALSSSRTSSVTLWGEKSCVLMWTRNSRKAWSDHLVPGLWTWALAGLELL